MNKDELIAELRVKFFEVDEEGIHEGKTEADITVWGIGVFDKTGDVLRKLNLTFYTKGDEAFWGVTEPKAVPPVPEPGFVDRANAFVASKIDDSTIKFGYIEQVSELTQKAMGTGIMPDNTEKKVLISEDATGVFTIEPL